VTSNSWSIALVSRRTQRSRWLTADGRISSDPARALRVLNPEVAARRVQAYLSVHGWPPEAAERFRLVPAPGRTETAQRQAA
jgi:hypothetical protein